MINSSFRFKDALKTDEFKDVKPEWVHEFFDTFHKTINTLDGADSWYETSSSDHDYEVCEGDFELNWKDKGYVTIFELLQVKL